MDEEASIKTVTEALDFDTLIAGRCARLGTRVDAVANWEFWKTRQRPGQRGLWKAASFHRDQAHRDNWRNTRNGPLLPCRSSNVIEQAYKNRATIRHRLTTLGVLPRCGVQH